VSAGREGGVAPGELLVGVLALRGRVEAHLVARTPFGRLRPGGRRAVEDDDDLGLPPAAGPGGDPSGAAGATWAGCIAGAVEKLTFGLPAARLRVGVAVDGEVDGARARVAGRGWCEDLPREVGRVLRTRGIELGAPGGVVAVGLASAWALGDAASAVGPAGNDVRALVLVWSDEPQWFLAEPSSRGRGPRVERLVAPRPADAGVDASAPGAERLAREAAELLEGPARSAARIVLTGPAVQGAAAGGRSSADLSLPFRAVLPPRLLQSDAAAPSVDESVRISTERGAPALGAVAAALAPSLAPSPDPGEARP